MSGPSGVRFTGHTHRRAGQRRIGLDAIEAAVLNGHDRRRRNPGQADWRLTHHGLVVLYDWPADDDPTLALVRSAWRR